MPKKKQTGAGKPASSPVKPAAPNPTARAEASIRFTPEDKATPPKPYSSQKFFVTGRAQDVGEIHLEVPREALREVIAQKQAAVTHIYRTLDGMQKDLRDFFPKITETLPTVADGILLNRDGTPAAGISVEALAPAYSPEEKKAHGAQANVPWTAPQDLTDVRGGFRLNLPPVPLPVAGLRLQLRGENAVMELNVKRVQLAGAQLGVIPVEGMLAPLRQESVVARLKEIQSDILATSAKDVADRPGDFATPAPQMTLGEGDCARLFRSNSGVIDSFRYSTLIRLIEPQMNQWQPLFRIGLEGDRFIPFAIPHAADGFWNAVGAQDAVVHLHDLGRLVLVNRTPIDRPIDVSNFHQQIEESPVFLPKASTLGMGYIVHMQQTWIPAGMSLGDLVYSLPLAPGEQQRIAIEESVKTASERSVETFSQDEFQAFKETQDSSALATFRSAFDEAASGGSHVDSSSQTGSVAAEASTGIVGAIFGGGGVSGGYSSSSSSGNTNSWQNTSRDFTSNAAQNMHSALSRVAAGSRRGSQTSIRVASETERTQVTTRIVTNHNKGHALTMQWWQVLRHFTVSSEVDDVQLVCFVPLELVQFLPEGQPFSLPGMPATRGELLKRYAMVLRYHDVLAPFFRRNAELAYGLRQLRDFAANPEAKPKTTATQQDIVHFAINGTFMPFEQVFVTVVCKSGAQIGPVLLTATGTSVDLTPEKFSSRAELIGALKQHRQPLAGFGVPTPGVTLQADIPLPDWLARTDVARFDVSRQFSSLSYKLKLPPVTFSNFAEVVQLSQNQTISLSPAELENELGGPWVHGGSATLPGNVNFLAGGLGFLFGTRMAGTLPLAALRIAPVLSFSDLLRIETVFHHIVRNTVFYSKAVWAALTAEERAILLERYTIGVPAGGVQTADQEVPLLNCAANQILGFFGNAAIMPFGIPPDVAAKMEVTSRDIQDALLRFHRQAFQPPRSSITLPAHGTLGEAVLGCCASAEKIDLTRFWNWQDSPSDQADAIPTSPFQPPQALAPAAASGGGSGVGGGSGSGSIISINSPPAAPQSTALLEALIKQSPDIAKELNLTGIETLQKQIAADTQSAATGRDKAIDANTQIQIQAMKSAESIVKSVADAAGKAADAGGKAAAGGV
ncbi:MAG: hypothetical protein PHC88_04760 [Terrimicrobiaceae bacterium]|nr:hypothetical protein [Terrimicrobiaceae bacterium]